MNRRIVTLSLSGILVLLAAATAAAQSEVDPALKKRIDSAIDAGARWLLARVDERGLWPAFSGSDGYVHDVGPTALACVAVVHAGVSRSDPRLEKAFTFVMAQPFRRTYDVSLAILAIEAKASPAKDAIRKYAESTERNLLPAEAAWMRRAVDWLLDNRKRDWWSYPLGNGDHSNTQFAILALKAASRCGIKVPKEVWYDLCQHFLRFQETKGPQVMLSLDKGEAASKTSRLTKRTTEARGWTYDKPCPAGEAYGSMTNVGIASLILCRSELTGYPRFSGKVATDIDAGVRDGLAWVQQNWSIEEHPRKKGEYHYYYLYSVERVGVLAEVVKIGEHDWFQEGAEYLLAHQEPDGHWNAGGWSSALSNTSFALLFLERSTIPATLNTTPRVGPPPK